MIPLGATATAVGKPEEETSQEPELTWKKSCTVDGSEFLDQLISGESPLLRVSCIIYIYIHTYLYTHIHTHTYTSLCILYVYIDMSAGAGLLPSTG